METTLPSPMAGSGIAMTTRFLHPGDVALALRGERLETLLGSCVAVLLSDPQHTIGAMCHIVHAGRREPVDPRDTSHAGPAMKSMFALLRSHGFAPEMCEAWILGGGNMFPEQDLIYPVGHANLDWVYQFLHREGIEVVGEAVGGSCYRRIGWTIGSDAPDITACGIDPQAASELGGH